MLSLSRCKDGDNLSTKLSLSSVCSLFTALEALLTAKSVPNGRFASHLPSLASSLSGSSITVSTNSNTRIGSSAFRSENQVLLGTTNAPFNLSLLTIGIDFSGWRAHGSATTLCFTVSSTLSKLTQGTKSSNLSSSKLSAPIPRSWEAGSGISAM